MNMDWETDFNIVVRAAVEIGMDHVARNKPRCKSEGVRALLHERFGVIRYRNFHVEIVNRAYGLAFINQQKMNWVKSRTA